MTTDSSEEIFNRYATNDKQTRPKKKRKIVPTKRKTYKDRRNIAKRYMVDIAPASVYIFNFFLFSSLGSLIPFLPVFFKLLGFSSLQNGLLFAVRPLISFWWGPLSSSFVTSSRYRKLFLFIFVAGTVASTFCLSVIRTNDGWILTDLSCDPYTLTAREDNRNYSISMQDFSLARVQQYIAVNDSILSQSQISAYNDTGPYSWKRYLKNAGHKIFHQLEKGMILKTLFMSVLALTIISELCLSPTLHVTQASIKFTSKQPVLNSQCLNRVFCKIGMAVASVSITYVAWKYQCMFRNVHYFYFHFYGFLATGCITAIISLALPAASPQKASFLTLVCNHVLSLVFSWDNFGYIFGLWIAGLSEGTINAYLLWYASENGASEIITGVLVCLAIITDMVLHFTVGMSMKWIGHNGLLSAGILLMSIQFFVISNVTNPYYIIPTQLMFGLASCCIKSSFIGGTNSNGTKEMEKVLFFIFQAAYMGLGLGLGGVFVSMPYFVFGAQKTFSALAVLTATYSLVCIMVQLVLYKRRRKLGRLDKQMYTKLNSYEPSSDWLVDAMVEDEKQSREGVKEKDELEETVSKETHHDIEMGNNNDEDNELNMQAIS